MLRRLPIPCEPGWAGQSLNGPIRAKTPTVSQQLPLKRLPLPDPTARWPHPNRLSISLLGRTELGRTPCSSLRSPDDNETVSPSIGALLNHLQHLFSSETLDHVQVLPIFGHRNVELPAQQGSEVDL